MRRSVRALPPGGAARAADTITSLWLLGVYDTYGYFRTPAGLPYEGGLPGYDAATSPYASRVTMRSALEIDQGLLWNERDSLPAGAWGYADQGLEDCRYDGSFKAVADCDLRLSLPAIEDPGLILGCSGSLTRGTTISWTCPFQVSSFQRAAGSRCPFSMFST